MNLQAEFSRRQIIGLLEKAVVDGKLPDTLLFAFEATLSWPFTKDQEKILLSYATKENLKKSAAKSAEIVKRIGKLAQGESIVASPSYSPPPPQVIQPQIIIEPRYVEPVRVFASHEPRYTKGEWERIQKNERDKEMAKAKVMAEKYKKDPDLNKFYRKIEVGE